VEDAYATAKREHRNYIAAPSDVKWQRYQQAAKSVTKIVEDAKSSSWKRAVAATAHKQEDLWRLERWARLRSWSPPESTTIPPLRRSEGETGTQNSHNGKAELFAERFFPDPRADPEALQAARKQRPNCEFIMFQRVKIDEIKDIIRNSRPWKAPEDNGLSIGFLKACGKPLFKALAAFAFSSFQAAYFPKRFKKARITMLPKPNKTAAQKFTPGAWRPISLLNTVGKIVEAAFARRITNVAEDKKLLLDGQMGNKQHKFINLAIKMVVKTAIKARKSGGIALLL
jgi:hypothetical protein